MSDVANPAPSSPEPGASCEGPARLAPFASRRMDPWLFFAAVALTGIGLIMVYSAGAWLGHTAYSGWTHFLARQCLFATAGFALMMALSRLDYRLLRRFAPQLMLGALVMLLLVLVVGTQINGARRWVRVGTLSLQPSELAKVALAVFLAATLARKGERVRAFTEGFLPVMTVAGLTMLLVLLEKDLGTTILLGSLTLIMLFVAGTRLSYVVAAVMVAAPVAWQQVLGVDYRRGRLEEFLSGDGYQVHQALISIGSGGWFGLGLGNGKQKLGFLPENHTDFILATIGEELGLVGILVVLSLMMLLVWRGIVVARRSRDRFGLYLAIGLSALFGLQAIINVSVVLEVIPAKGITLPFLSYGGSSLLTSMGAVGLLLSISRSPAAWRLSDQRRAAGRARRSGRTPRSQRRSSRAHNPGRRNARRRQTGESDAAPERAC